MATERVRDRIIGGAAEEDLARRPAQGWRIAAIEWERESSGGNTPSGQVDPPYGYRVASDCVHLQADEEELEVLSQITAMIVQERRVPEIAAALNRQGFRTRTGEDWTPVAVFSLMPRIVDESPLIFRSPGWEERRRAGV
jgi:hypothetical protein